MIIIIIINNNNNNYNNTEHIVQCNDLKGKKCDAVKGWMKCNSLESAEHSGARESGCWGFDRPVAEGQSSKGCEVCKDLNNVFSS